VLFLVERGTPLIAAAAYLAGVQAIAVAARFLWGVVADQSEAGYRWVVLAAVVAVSAAGIAALAALPSAAPGWMLGGVTVLLGLGIISWAGMIELVRSEMVGAGATAPATGVGYTLGAIGGVTGPPLFGLVVEAGGFPAAWGTLAVSLVAAILLSLMLRGALGRKGSAAAPEGADGPTRARRRRGGPPGTAGMIVAEMVAATVAACRGLRDHRASIRLVGMATSGSGWGRPGCERIGA
jgi:MFS family permease